MSAGLEAGYALPSLTVSLSRTDLVRYAGASGDFNPIHHSEFFAAKVGLPGVIAHGMLTMATALRVVTDWTGDPVAVTSYGVRFTKPVVVADDGHGAELTISAVLGEVDDNQATVKIEAVVAAQGAGSEHGGEKVLGMAVATVDLNRVHPRSAAARAIAG